MDITEARIMYQQNMPHTFTAMQSMVMAMEAAYKSAGKKTFFGMDKGRAAYEKFLATLGPTIRSMILDGLVEEADDEAAILNWLRTCITGFETAFPNWPDAYNFAFYFFGDGNKANALAVIARVR